MHRVLAAGALSLRFGPNSLLMKPAGLGLLVSRSLLEGQRRSQVGVNKSQRETRGIVRVNFPEDPNPSLKAPSHNCNPLATALMDMHLLSLGKFTTLT